MLGGVLFVSLMDDLEKHLESRGYTLIWGSLLSSSTCVFLLFSFFCSIHLIQYVSLVLSLRVDVAESKHYRLSNQFLNLMTKHYRYTLPNLDLCLSNLTCWEILILKYDSLILPANTMTAVDL